MTQFSMALAVLMLVTSVAEADDEIGPDFYPSIGFTVLDPQERLQFVDLAAGEACPCPGTERTLSDCLQTPSDRCRVAVQLASLMMRRLKEDMPLEEIRDAVARQIATATTPLEFDLEHVNFRGSPEAPLQLVVFSDFECPSCRQFATRLDMIAEQYGDQICIYFKHFPLPQHQNAEPAARAANAAGRQGRFWEMHDLLFENQSQLRDSAELTALFLRLAADLGLDVEQFANDLEDPALARLPGRDRAEGQAAGVRATPSLYVNGFEYAEEWSVEGIRVYLDALVLAPQ